MKKLSTKNALLVSVLAMVLCVSMLVGTTFAWFTDTASTNVNKIQAGTLDVALEVATAWDDAGIPTTWENAEGKTLNFIKAAGAPTDEAVLWEPGCTYALSDLRIVNKGNLAFKYNVVISAVGGDSELADVIDVYEAVGKDVNRADRINLGTEVKPIYAVHIGTLNELFAESIEGNLEGNLEAEDAEEIKLYFHMQETAGNEYQGMSIDEIAITVYATQDTVEYDSNSNTYDENAQYSNVITGDAILNGTYVAFNNNGADGTEDKNAVRIQSGNVVITGGYYDGASGGNNAAVRADGENTNVTIKGGYFTVGPDANGKGNNVIYATTGAKITIEGGTFYTEYDFNGKYYVLNGKDNTNGSITVKGGKFYKFDPSQASVNGSSFYVGAGEITVADGYEVKKIGDWYYVVPVNATLTNSASALVSALGNDSTTNTVVLSGNVTTGNNASYGGSDVGITVNGGKTLDGNGNTLSKGDNAGYAILTNGATIKNLTLNDSGRAIYIDKISSDVVIDNVVIDGAGYAINTGYKGDSTSKMTVTNSTVNGWISFGNIASASFTDCSFGSSDYFKKLGYGEEYCHYLRPYVSATFTNCDFEEGFYIDLTKLGTDCTVTLDNCTCNGVKLTNDNFADYVKIIKDVESNSDVYAVNGDSLANCIFR